MTSKESKLELSSFDQRVGEIVTFIGLKGAMKVRAASNNPTLFLDIENVLLKPIAQDSKGKPQNDVQAIVKDIKLVKNFLQLQLNEYDSRTAVEAFRGAHIYTAKSELRDLSKNEWWVNDLIGLEVYTPDGKLIGTVCDAPGEHGEFLEIKKVDVSKGETAIISFVKELFPVVNIKAKRIEVIDLPGLFE
jgi:16S rRNA processing protein RimM